MLRDPSLKKAYDLFGIKGIGTSAASDIENIARRTARQSQTPRSSSTWPHSNGGAATGRSSDFYSGRGDFGSTWQSESNSNSSNRKGKAVPVDGKGVGGPSPGYSERTGSYTKQNQVGVVDPNAVGGVGNSSRQSRTSNTSKRDTFPMNPSHFESQAWSSNKNGRHYKSGPKPHDNTAYYGDMGSVHTQPRTRTSFEDNLFIPHDGSPLTGGEAFFGRGPKFGRDVLIDVEIDSSTAKFGGKKSIEVKHMKTCSTCNGVGTQDAKSTITTCRHCGGSGHTIGVSQMRETCPSCLGTGRIIRNPCKSCHGLGFEKTTKSLEILIPKRIDDGYTLRVPGEGDAGPNGGPAGDLYVCFRILGAKEISGNSPGKTDLKNEENDAKSRANVQNFGGHNSNAVTLDISSSATVASKPTNGQSNKNVAKETPFLQPDKGRAVKSPIHQPTASVSIKPSIRQPTTGSARVAFNQPIRKPSATVAVNPSTRQPESTVVAKVQSTEPFTAVATDVTKEAPTRRRRRDRIGGFFGGIMSNLLSK